jgi:hypothetical protein
MRLKAENKVWGDTRGAVGGDVLVQWAVLEVHFSRARAPLLQPALGVPEVCTSVDVHEYHSHTEIAD